jgi:hypothetical protein
MRDVRHEGTQWMVARFDANDGRAFAPLKAIVAPDICQGDSFRECIELLFASRCHDFSTRGVFLWRWIPASKIRRYKGGSIVHLLRLLSEVTPLCASLR